MDKIAKQFRKIPKDDRISIENTLKNISKRNYKGLNLKRLKGYKNIYRVRTGNYRIIYFDDGKDIILKAIKKRDESTYKGI